MQQMIDKTKLRSTDWQGKTAFYVSDIEDSYGEGVINKLPRESRFAAFVNHDGAIRQRRLVFEEAVDQFNKQEAIPVQPLQGEQVQMYLKPVIDAKLVREHLASPQELQKVKLKEEITKLINDTANARIKAKGLTPQQVAASDREDHREAYKTLYAQFDRILRIELGKQGRTLEDIGLGRAKNQTGKPYIDRIGDAGHLENLAIVAREIYG